jgi:dUTP pyrophosphatase
MKPIQVAIKKRGDSVQTPFYATRLSAGADLSADIDEPIVIQPQTTQLIPTGLFFEIPEGFEIQVRPRSGLALKFGITVLNTPGTIDADYRGELKVILINHSNQPFVVEPRMRIAQMVLARVEQAEFFEVETLEHSERGLGGFGHSGV